MDPIVADAEDPSQADVVQEDMTPVDEMESLCMRCGQNGTTRMLLTRIPHFREIVLMAFECPNCNERNNEVQFAGQLQAQGCCYTLKVPKCDLNVLNRQVVKSDSATIKVPELEFEVPPEAQSGTLSTVEGVLLKAIEGLQALQEERWRADPSTAEALDAFLVKLKSYAAGEIAFTFILDDPAGNSFIENPYAPAQDMLLSVCFYERSPEQQARLGFFADTSLTAEPALSLQNALCDKSAGLEKQGHAPAGTTKVSQGAVGAERTYKAIAQSNSEKIDATFFKYSAPEEVMTFPATCSMCDGKCETRMYATYIPCFREVIVMASVCDNCGYKNSEIKPAGSIPPKGKKISLQILNKGDLSRDVIKSDTAGVVVPELELELVPGTLGGLVTTVEGILVQISENLRRVHGFSIGDSAADGTRKRWQEFDMRLNKLLGVQQPWTLVLDDPLGNSFIAPATEFTEDDAQLKFEEYDRTWDQNEELGLNDLDA